MLLTGVVRELQQRRVAIGLQQAHSVSILPCMFVFCFFFFLVSSFFRLLLASFLSLFLSFLLHGFSYSTILRNSHCLWFCFSSFSVFLPFHLLLVFSSASWSIVILLCILSFPFLSLCILHPYPTSRAHYSTTERQREETLRQTDRSSTPSRPLGRLPHSLIFPFPNKRHRQSPFALPTISREIVESCLASPGPFPLHFQSHLQKFLLIPLPLSRLNTILHSALCPLCATARSFDKQELKGPLGFPCPTNKTNESRWVLFKRPHHRPDPFCPPIPSPLP